MAIGRKDFLYLSVLYRRERNCPPPLFLWSMKMSWSGWSVLFRMASTFYTRPGHCTARGPHTALWLTLPGPHKVNWKLQNKCIFSFYLMHGLRLHCFYFEVVFYVHNDAIRIATRACDWHGDWQDTCSPQKCPLMQKKKGRCRIQDFQQKNVSKKIVLEWMWLKLLTNISHKCKKKKVHILHFFGKLDWVWCVSFNVWSTKTILCL